MSVIEEKSIPAVMDSMEELKNMENDMAKQGFLEGQPMSKRQFKKLKKQENFLLKKSERRSAERQKRKQRRAEKLANNEDLGPSKKKLKANTMENSNCKIRVVVDCSFDELMTDKDIMKLSQQLQYCYSRNRRAIDPMQFYMTSLDGKTLARLEQIGFYRSWDIYRKENSYLDNFANDEIVYLTSDSPNTLEDLTPDKVYIIGGLVDHNHHKGLCYDLALKNNIGHARLPISDFMKLSSRNVLTVNHVFEILLRFTESKNWRDAFYSVIPKRKIVDNNKKNEIDVKVSEDHRVEPVAEMTAEEHESDDDDDIANDNDDNIGNDNDDQHFEESES